MMSAKKYAVEKDGGWDKKWMEQPLMKGRREWELCGGRTRQ